MLSISFLPPFSSGYYFPYERMMPSSEALSIFGRSIHPSAWKDNSPKFAPYECLCGIMARRDRGRLSPREEVGHEQL